MSYNTKRRAELIEFLSKNDKTAFSTEEIALALLKDGKGKSTLYRLINELLKSGDIRRIQQGATRHVKYQYIKKKTCHEHLHLKCQECGKLIHLRHDVSDFLLKNIENNTHFALDIDEVLFGRCEDCRNG
jgi:Fur family ferric uptake transcriptional regulator